MARTSSRPDTHRLHLGLVGGIVALALAGFIWIPEAEGFDRYQDGCNDNGCHGDFTGDITTKGSIFPSGNKHEMHRASAEMNTDCNMCHTNGDNRNPYIGSSQEDGDGNSGGPGCSGCHDGQGLRLHHANNGQTFCGSAGCHSLTAGPAENMNPEYYGTPGTNADDGCNTVMAARTGENWSLNDFIGLDNDGDNFYDTADPDCAVQPTGAGESGLLMVVMEANGDLSFTWADSCLASDNDYGLYEGVLQPIPPLGGAARVFDTHQFVQCTTSGANSTTVTPTGDLQYYLVVPTNGVEEGSYGTNNFSGTQTERGQGINSCVTQLLGTC